MFNVMTLQDLTSRKVFFTRTAVVFDVVQAETAARRKPSVNATNRRLTPCRSHLLTMPDVRDRRGL